MVVGFTTISAQSESGFYNKAQFLSQLGICEEKDESAPVTRGEFTAMAVRCLNLDFTSADSGFSDVPAEHKFKKEIDNAKSLGIIHGIGGGEFYPEQGISLNAAIKILINTLGYEKAAVVSGDFPAGYVTVAANLRLTRGVPATEGNLLFGEAVALVYNALYTDIYSETGISAGNIIYSSQNGKNPLTERFDLVLAEGVIESVGFYAIYDSGSYGQLSVDGKLLGFDGKNTEYTGRYARVWYDGDTDKVAAVDVDVKNSTVELDAEEIFGRAGFEIETEKGDYQLDNGFAFVLNGRAIAPVSSDFKLEEGSFTLLDNNADGKYDVVFAKKPVYMFVKAINSRTMTVYDKTVLNLEEDEKKDIIYPDGKSFRDIAEKSVLTVYESRDKLYKEVYISNNALNGKVDEISGRELMIDGTEYDTNSRFEGVMVGSVGVFYLANDKTIAAFLEGDSGLKYGYVLDCAKGEGISSDISVRLLTADNKKQIFEIADTVILQGKAQDADKVFEEFVSGSAINYQLIRYSTDAYGKIKIVDLADDYSSLTDIIEKYEVRENTNNSLTKYLSEEKVWYYSTPDAGAPNFIFGSALIFSVPENMVPGTFYSDDMFSVINTSNLTSSSDYIVDVYDYSEDFVPGAVVIYSTKTSDFGEYMAIPSRSAVSYVVSDISTATYDGIETKKIYAYGNNSYESFLISPDYVKTLQSLGRIPVSGDIVRFAIDGNGLVIGISRDVKFNSKNLSVSYGIDGVNNAGNGSITYVTGKAFSCSDSVLSLKVENYPPTVTSYPAPADSIAAFNVSKLVDVVVYESKSGEVRRSELSDIVPMRISKSDASHLALRTGYSEPKLIVIYR